MNRSYQTDLTDAEWEALEPHLPAPKKRGRPRTHSPREILNAVFYVLKSGCPWRLLPRDFPPWETVYWWFGRWRTDGTFERLNAELGERLRSRLGRDPLPSSAAIADSQTTKSTGVGGEQRGYYDGNKKVRGRKRHLLVDTRRAWCSKPCRTQREGTGPGWAEAPAGVSAYGAFAPQAPVARGGI
jgi:putative transposase